MTQRMTPENVRRLKARLKREHLEMKFLDQLHRLGCPEPVTQFRFDPKRRWRFDFAWPDFDVAVDIDGGTWIGGRHTTGVGYQKDTEKMNAANILGWTMLRFTTNDVMNGSAANQTNVVIQRLMGK